MLDGILDLKITVLDLEEENRNLKTRLTAKENIKRDPKSGFWFKEGETEPLCPKCYEGPTNAVVYLTPHRSSQYTSYTRECRICSEQYSGS